MTQNEKTLAKPENEIQKETQKEGQQETRKKSLPFAADVFADNKNYYLEASLPGADKESIDITVDHENKLTIFASRSLPSFSNDSKEARNGGIQYAEYDDFDYKRVFQIDEKVAVDQVEAAYKDGVLRIRLPFKAPVVQKIEVKTGP